MVRQHPQLSGTTKFDHYSFQEHVNAWEDMSDEVQDTLERIIQFVKNEEDIRAAMMVGSRARSVVPADKWSDIDIIIATTMPEKYLESASWLGVLGLEPSITFVEETAVGNERERRVLFSNGVDVDFSIIPFSHFEFIAKIDPPPEEVVSVFRRGLRIFKDEENLLSYLVKDTLKVHRGLPRQITEQEFHHSINDFLYHYVLAARKLRRGELWTAKFTCDSYMKRLLLQMIEWYMRAEQGDDYDTWHSGRFIEKWADESIVNRLPSTFARYDASDITSALGATTDLYTLLAKNVARVRGFTYPVETDLFAHKQAEIAMGS